MRRIIMKKRNLLKKPTAFFLSAFMAALCVPSALAAQPSSAAYEIRLGDVNFDGDISVADAILVQKHVVNIRGITSDAVPFCDVDKNGEITVADAIEVQKHTLSILKIEDDAARHSYFDTSGQIVSYNDSAEVNPNSSGYIGGKRAKAIAYEHAGVSEDDVRRLEIEVDRRKGAVVYEVEFVVAGYEYEYEIDVTSGAIVHSYKELDDDFRLGDIDPSSKAYIGAQKAKEIAYEHAGVSADSLKKLEIELNRKRGVVVYEIEFEAGGYEYDYDINAETGEIVTSYKERDNDFTADPGVVDPSSGNYIGEARAKEIALSHAGLSAENVIELEAELDRIGGVVVYEVEFKSGGYDYDYYINAESGEIISSYKEHDDYRKDTDVTPPSSSDYIGEQKAKEIALSHAGLSADKVSALEIELDSKRGVVVYEVDFKYGGCEYDYDINAVSGEIVSSYKELDDNRDPVIDPNNNGYIGEQKAKEIAVAHAGVSADSVRMVEIELDVKRGVVVYEIEFKSGGFEYDYDIDAVSGEVISSYKELGDYRDDTNKFDPDSKEYIGEQSARDIALTHAGVSAGSVREFEIELDREKGRVVYEIEFKSGGFEYEYEIDAYTGDIIKHEKERD